MDPMWEFMNSFESSTWEKKRENKSYKGKLLITLKILKELYIYQKID